MLTNSSSSRQAIYFFFLFLSAFFSFLLVTFGYFPYFGMGIFFSALSTVIFCFKKKKSSYLWFLYLSTLTFSFLIFYRVNTSLLLLNIISVVYLGSLLTLGHKEYKSILVLLASPLHVFFHSIDTKSDYNLKHENLTGKLKNEIEKLPGLFPSILITFAILFIIIPLLSYSNPFFEKIVSDFLNILKLDILAELLFVENFMVNFTRLLFFIIFAIFIPKLATFSKNQTKETAISGPLVKVEHLIIPKMVTAFVLGVFFVTQFQLYFSDQNTLTILGYSHSQYAREVFAHLLVVTLIVFGLIYNDRSKKSMSKLLTYFLISEAVFLNFAALKSVFDYSSQWGFTHKRLYGYTGVIWIFGALLLFTYKYIKNAKNAKFIKYTLFWTLIVLLAVNIVNFDYIIYHFAKSTTHSGVDHHYLSRLSADSQSYADHLEKIIDEIEKEEKVDLTKLKSARTLVSKIKYLRKKYDTLNIRTLNLSEYSAYKKTNNLNLEDVLYILNTKENQTRQAILYSANSSYYEVKQKTIPPNITRTADLSEKTILPTVAVYIIDLDRNLFNHNFEIRKDDTDEMLYQGSLDNDSFIHVQGRGKFSITIYDYLKTANDTKEVPAKKLHYEINKKTEEKGFLSLN